MFYPSQDFFRSFRYSMMPTGHEEERRLEKAKNSRACTVEAPQPGRAPSVAVWVFQNMGAGRAPLEMCRGLLPWVHLLYSIQW